MISLVLGKFFWLFCEILFEKNPQNLKIIKNWSAEYVSSLQNFFLETTYVKSKNLKKKKKGKFKKHSVCLSASDSMFSTIIILNANSSLSSKP